MTPQDDGETYGKLLRRVVLLSLLFTAVILGGWILILCGVLASPPLWRIAALLSIASYLLFSVRGIAAGNLYRRTGWTPVSWLLYASTLVLSALAAFNAPEPFRSIGLAGQILQAVGLVIGEWGAGSIEGLLQVGRTGRASQRDEGG